MGRDSTLIIYSKTEKDPETEDYVRVAVFPLGGSSFSDSLMDKMGMTPESFHDMGYWFGRVLSPVETFEMIDIPDRWFGMDEVLKNKHNLLDKYDKPEYQWVIEIDG